MKKYFLALVLVLSANALAKQLTPQDIRNQLQVNADIYLLDQSGKKILSGPMGTNYWRANSESGAITGGWSSKFEMGSVVMRQSWEVDSSGSIRVVIEEFTSEFTDHGEPLYKTLLDKKEFALDNFEPVIWKVKNIKNQHFVVRFIPSLREISTPISVESLPVAGTGISISDNQGFLWADGVEFNGKYSGVTTHRGTLAISYSPFSGAKEMGFAEGNQIILKADQKTQITLKCATSFLPAGVTAKVYAVYLPKKRSTGLNSLHSFDSSKESRIQEKLKE